MSKQKDEPQHLVDGFRVTEEKAKEDLQKENNDINRAGAAILDTLEDDVPLESKRSSSHDRIPSAASCGLREPHACVTSPIGFR